VRISLLAEGRSSWLCAIEHWSVVTSVIEEFLSLETAIGDSGETLVEWFIDIEVVSVRCSHHVRVHVLLVHPVGSVPQLTVALVPRSVCV